MSLHPLSEYKRNHFHLTFFGSAFFYKVNAERMKKIVVVLLQTDALLDILNSQLIWVLLLAFAVLTSHWRYLLSLFGLLSFYAVELENGLYL